MELDLIVHNDEELKEISFNFEELKQELKIKLNNYKGLVYTDDTIQVAKKDKANLNKLKKAINAKRISVKKRCLKPYNEFEDKVKELLELVEEPIEQIDKQVQEYTKIQKEQKYNDIEKYYLSKIGNLKNILSLSRIEKPQWLNVSYSFNDIQKEIDTQISKVSEEIKIIKDMDAEFEKELLDTYSKELSFVETVKKYEALKEIKRKAEERLLELQAQKEVEKQLQEKLDSIAELEVNMQEDIQQEDIQDFYKDTKRLERLDITLFVTPEQKEQLRAFILENNITCL